MYSSLFLSLIFALLSCCSTSASAEIITLQNGDIIHAVVKEKTDTQIYIEHVNLGAFPILLENIVSINYEGEAISDKKAAVSPFVDKGLFYSGFFRNWKRTLEVSLNGAVGVSDNSKFRSALEMRYEDNKERWLYSMFYLQTEKDNKTEENRLTANLIRDWLLPDSKWFYFSKVGYDWDKFKDWDYRIRSAGGLGYEFVKNEKLNIRSRFGPSTYHTVGDENSTTVMEANFGLEMLWKIWDNHTLGIHNDLYPSISNKGEYRNVSTLDWKINLNYYHDLGVKFGLYNEFDSTEEDQFDLKYSISLILGL
ncbi:MAG: DUF481 domain-containing protein [Candidatus Scalindua sp. AMX11]|nr:MAG: DUF481 domain-containing protein [Candidatus Scalindua sp.]NOG84738.1 DUF481 domain-containing protein [Planctomycetota bacterium]RZV98344.1 MAG: DUF481 domain-containing protein [Candidatus Scalindua sp. SCAELEC01]TDE66563.1 MAG: DUF481 domain-containing protein [Candidatus Scalindua sp. AMX11]GJQ58932.1 MAG: hypothetical protein SCALA701_17330 [Candidatus Scalindua sp.]